MCIPTSVCFLEAQQNIRGNKVIGDGDGFETFQGANIFDVANLSLDEPTMETVIFADDE